MATDHQNLQMKNQLANLLEGVLAILMKPSAPHNPL